MMTVEAIKQALKDRRISLVSKATGLHYNTLRDIRDNPNADPKASTIKAISEYLAEQNNAV